MKKTKKKPIEAVEVICVPVESILAMIEEATAKGMQRGAQIVLQELRGGAEQGETPEQPKSDADIFLGASDD